MLPVKHYHVIFTLPHQLNDLFYYNKWKMYSLFFETVWETVQQVTGEGLAGMVATLHTWGSNLSYHPHIHCIVSGGTLLGNDWILLNLNKKRFFVKPKVLREKFKEIFLSKFLILIDCDILYLDGLSINDYTLKKILKIYNKIKRINWSVRIETPVLGTQQIIEYLGRYVKRVAITNSRILDVGEEKVTFEYNVYADQEEGKPAPKGKIKMYGVRFLQQFTQHILPRYFQRVRYYGLYAWTNKKKKQIAYESLQGEEQEAYVRPLKKHLVKKMLGSDPDQCPVCNNYNTLLMLPLPSEEVAKKFRLGRNSGSAGKLKQGVLDLGFA